MLVTWCFQPKLPQSDEKDICIGVIGFDNVCFQPANTKCAREVPRLMSLKVYFGPKLQIMKFPLLEIRKLSEVGGGPKSKVFYMHSAVLPPFIFCMCSRASQRCNPNVDIRWKLISLAINPPILVPTVRAVHVSKSSWWSSPELLSMPRMGVPCAPCHRPPPQQTRTLLGCLSFFCGRKFHYLNRRVLEFETADKMHTRLVSFIKTVGRFWKKSTDRGLEWVNRYLSTAP